MGMERGCQQNDSLVKGLLAAPEGVEVVVCSGFFAEEREHLMIETTPRGY